MCINHLLVHTILSPNLSLVVVIDGNGIIYRSSILGGPHYVLLFFCMTDNVSYYCGRSYEWMDG